MLLAVRIVGSTRVCRASERARRPSLLGQHACIVDSNIVLAEMRAVRGLDVGLRGNGSNPFSDEIAGNGWMSRREFPADHARFLRGGGLLFVEQVERDREHARHQQELKDEISYDRHLERADDVAHVLEKGRGASQDCGFCEAPRATKLRTSASGQ